MKLFGTLCIGTDIVFMFIWTEEIVFICTGIGLVFWVEFDCSSMSKILNDPFFGALVSGLNYLIITLDHQNQKYYH